MIHIIQCLCPNRHAIFATVYEIESLSDKEALAQMRQLVEELITSKTINPWCGICNLDNWHYEQAPTKWKTMVEARIEARKLELENLLTRMQIDQSKAVKN